MSSPSISPVEAPPHVLQLLSTLHQQSLAQETANFQPGRVASSTVLGDMEDRIPKPDIPAAFDDLMRDKFIALNEKKCQFTYQLLISMGATNVIEAGTSFGVSTIYLALAVAKAGKLGGRVIATENEPEKARVARTYWQQCGEEVTNMIDLREGDILETLKRDVPEMVDLVLLDIWSNLSLPTLKLVLPSLRYGAVVLTDNTVSGAKGYADLLAFLREPENGFRTMTLPFEGGFEMSVYLPGRK